jgi:hypothetical protein
MLPQCDYDALQLSRARNSKIKIPDNTSKQANQISNQGRTKGHFQLAA